MIEINKQDITELLEQLNDYAVSVDAYEYGLPITDYDNRLSNMQNIVEKWLVRRGIEYELYQGEKECIK